MKRILLLTILLLSLHLQAATQDSTAAGHAAVSIPSYYHMTGQIDSKYDITMDLLVQAWPSRGGEVVVNGSYYYKSIKEPIMFFWGSYKDGQISIKPANGEVAESFTGRFDGNEFKGTWTSTGALKNDKVRKLPFVLQQDTSDGIGLSLHYFADSFIAYKKLANTPAVFYQHELLLPDSLDNPPLARMFYQLYGKATSYDAMVRSIKNDSKKYIADFRKYEMKNVSKGDPDYPCWRYSCQYRINYDTRILYNSKELLSFRYTWYGDEGMNHGYARPEYHSYSVAQQRLVKLSDIVAPADTPVLKAALHQHLRKLYHLSPADDGETEILPSNFYVMPKGIAFIHDGPMAHVEPFAVFIPFTELGGKLRKQAWMEL